MSKDLNKAFCDERGWPIWERGLKVAFGLEPQAKWPDQGLPPRNVQGIAVFVLSKEQAKARGLFHRARAVCPNCHETLSAGRLRQHKCKGEGA